MNKPILGVLGGVGPLATACFMELVIKRTCAATDQDNIPMIVYNDPQIPDRTDYILGRSEANPRPEMAKVARWLEDAGADYIAIPCNTAHYFYEDICDAVHIPVLNIMELTAQRVAEHIGPGGTVGLTATDGTIESGVFQSYFERVGLQTMVPSEQDRALVMSAIYDGVKAGRRLDPDAYLGVTRRLHEAGCGEVIVGCTELSVVYQELGDKPDYLVDSLEVLADACVGFYRDWRAHSPESV